MTSSGSATSCNVLPDLMVADATVDLTNSVDPSTEMSVHFSFTSILSQWEIAASSVPGPFGVNGRRYFFGLASPVAAPGDEGASSRAYVWELQEGQGQESLGTSVVVTGECPGAGAARSAAFGLGSFLAEVRPVAIAGLRGVHVFYASNETCPGGQPRGASFFFQCAPNQLEPTPSHKDSDGLYHMPNLRLRPSDASSSTSCTNVSFEWMTSAACPPCRVVDYAPQPGDCGSDGNREVAFMLVRACIEDAESAPRPYRERCQGAQNSVALVLFFIVGAVLMCGCLIGLCCYACHLHRKYAKFLPEV